ncbi:hypothetical protein PUN28_009245 [Cardiocondyla obscurior]|uniref:Uncharacterized protein n=1 Tax=Cardiocondyla obscurior TaxID=286306 RepID=A0AAW2FR50_9HYME
MPRGKELTAAFRGGMFRGVQKSWRDSERSHAGVGSSARPRHDMTPIYVKRIPTSRICTITYVNHAIFIIYRNLAG